MMCVTMENDSERMDNKGHSAGDEQGNGKSPSFMEEIMDYREKYDRPDYDTYFMNMAFLIATRTTCFRRTVGAVIVKDQRILSTGYNGAPRGVKDCRELGFCIRKKENVPSGQRHELCRGVHAEQNAVANAAYFGVAINGASIYMTESPCNICTKILINAGIREIIYARHYMDDLSSELLKESNITVKRFTVRPTIEDFAVDQNNESEQES